MSLESLMGGPLRVVNLGLELFAEELRAEGAEVVHVDWRPPAGGNPRLARLLEGLEELDRRED
ncbi:MAG: fdrA domain protein [Candidatus Tectomicrobia bacterium]|uniref:FdrA domain protein n=1 Tax=Tectimicrobiota bacterium TaxID=2528274 RepID=A0A932I1E5_UNCTE|nr:fdrA domain protein [Candidatus Tectomicrobia bacterium]